MLSCASVASGGVESVGEDGGGVPRWDDLGDGGGLGGGVPTGARACMRSGA